MVLSQQTPKLWNVYIVHTQANGEVEVRTAGIDGGYKHEKPQTNAWHKEIHFQISELAVALIIFLTKVLNCS